VALTNSHSSCAPCKPAINNSKTSEAYSKQANSELQPAGSTDQCGISNTWTCQTQNTKQSSARDNLLKENWLAITIGNQKAGSHKAQCLRIAQMVCQLLQIIRSEFIILIVQNMIVSWASCSLHNITSSKLSRNQEMKTSNNLLSYQNAQWLRNQDIRWTSHNLLSHPDAQWSRNQRYKKNPHNLLSHESAGCVKEMYIEACMTAQEEVIIGRMAYVLINYCTCTNYVSVRILQFCIIRNTWSSEWLLISIKNFTWKNISIPHTIWIWNRKETSVFSLLGNYEGDLWVVPILQCLTCLLDEPLSSQLKTCALKTEGNKETLEKNIRLKHFWAALLLTLGEKKKPGI
jgi:hypothetical protein